MLRLFLILLLCALFAACSSDETTTLKEWFDDQGIATSYGKLYKEIDVSLKKESSSLGYDTAAYIVSSYAALGNVNNVEQMLYFGLDVGSSLSPVWKLRADSVFYTEIYDGKVPEEYKNIEARFYWLWENKNETKHDTTWLKFQEPFKDSADISINWETGGTRDTFSLSLPEALLTEFSSLRASAGDTTLKLLAGIKTLSSDKILRLAPPSISDIPNILRVAQKTYAESCGPLCLYSGIRESLNVVIEVDKNKIIAGKTVVFAQLVLPKSINTTINELGLPLPVYVYVYNNGNMEDYKIDTAFVKDYGHPNIVFWESDTLKLQVTKNLRNYVNISKNATNLPDTIGFTLRLGTPMLNPKSLYFYNPTYGTEKVFADRPAYSSYDFNTVFEGAKLRLWYAETDIH